MNDLLTTGGDKETTQSQTDALLTNVESQSEVAEDPDVYDSDSEPVQEETEAELTPVRAGTGHYGLRERVSPLRNLCESIYLLGTS